MTSAIKRRNISDPQAEQISMWAMMEAASTMSPNSDTENTGTSQISFWAWMNEKSESQPASDVHTATGCNSLFCQDIVDQFLRLSSASHRERQLLTALLSRNGISDGYIHEKLKKQFSLEPAGIGKIVNGSEISAWIDEFGVTLAPGKYALGKSAVQKIPWLEVISRVRVLVKDGKYGTIEDVNASFDAERRKTALHLLYAKADCSRNFLSPIVPQLKEFAGYPEMERVLSDALKSKQTVDAVYRAVEDTLQGLDAGSVKVRFPHASRLLRECKQSLWEMLHDVTIVPNLPHDDIPFSQEFITDDEINYFFKRHTHYLDRATNRGQSACKSMEAALATEFGIGGYSPCFSMRLGSEDHCGKGIFFTKKDCEKVSLTWKKVADIYAVI